MTSPTLSCNLPSDYARLKVVHSFQELVTTPWEAGINALCWPRVLAGNFGEVVERLGASEGIASVSPARLSALSLSPQGKLAREILLEDHRLLRDHGLSPELNCLQSYPRDEEGEVVRTDVYSFHADSAPVEANTYLCTYFGAPSEGLRNDEAIRRVEIPETRLALRERFGSGSDADFSDYLSENCYDLHYAAAPNARPFSFGAGNFWRIAIDHPGCPVPPCVHRAPETFPGQPPRLLLIS